MFEIEKGATDEVYFILKWNLEIRIHELLEDLASLQGKIRIKPASVSMIDVLEFKTSHEIEMDHISSMSESRKAQPILLACIQNELWVIDGNHRLKKKEQDGDIECDVVFIPNEVLCKYSQPLNKGKSNRRKRKQMEDIKEVLEIPSKNYE
ncbi:hypothetical protein MT390_00715 [Vibrio sp. 2-Bac 85]